MTFSTNLIDKNNETKKDLKKLIAELTNLSTSQNNSNNNYKLYKHKIKMSNQLISICTYFIKIYSFI